MSSEDLIRDGIQKMVRLLSLIAVGDKKQVEQIRLLSKAGFQPKEIADLIGTTSNTVRVAIASFKKKKRGRAKDAKKR